MVFESDGSILFPTGSIPKSIKRSCLVLENTNKNDLLKLLECIQCKLCRNPIPSLSTLQLKHDEICKVYEGLEDLFNAICKLPENKCSKQILETELKVCGINDTCRDAFLLYFFDDGNLIKMRNTSTSNNLRYVDCKWRIDIGISTSLLQRSLQPTVMMEMKLSDGSKRTFEMTVEKFNEFRYNVAAMLKIMLDIDKRLALA